MRKLLTQAEISYAIGNIAMVTSDNSVLTSLMDLSYHIDALTAELAYAHQRIKETKDEHAETYRLLKGANEEISRRDALAGEPALIITQTRHNKSLTSKSFDWLSKLKDGENIFYAAPSAPGVQDDLGELISKHRISLECEYEGGWRARIYGNCLNHYKSAYAATPIEAVQAVLQPLSAPSKEDAK